MVESYQKYLKAALVGSVVGYGVETGVTFTPMTVGACCALLPSCYLAPVRRSDWPIFAVPLTRPPRCSS